MKKHLLNAICRKLAAMAGIAAILVGHAFAVCAVVAQSQPTASLKAPGTEKRTKITTGDHAKGAAAKPERTAYDFNLPGPDGKDVPLSQYTGKYILLVNLGRKSTYSDQLAGLTKLSEIFKDKNVVVIGVPSNDFGQAEPGTAAEIQKAYTDAKVTFPIMALSKVSGDDELPLYSFLTKGKNALPGGPVHWNYTKFVIGPKGQLLARLDPDVSPDSPEMLSTIDQILDGTWKPKKSGDKGAAGKPAEAEDDDED